METAASVDDEGGTVADYDASNDCLDNSVRILVGNVGRVFVVNRTKLCHISPVFQAMLSGGWRESSGEICITDTDPLVFGSFVNFITARAVSLTDDTVWEMLKLADKYQVEPLVFFCFRYLLTRHECCDQYPHLVSVMETAHRTHREEFRKCCLACVKERAMDVLRDRKCLSELCQECMLTLVKASNLEVSDESVVHEAVIRWARLACGRRGIKKARWEDLRAEAGELVGFVRYLVIRQPAREAILTGDRDNSLLTGQEKRDLLYSRDPTNDRYNGALFPPAVQDEREVKGASDLTARRTRFASPAGGQVLNCKTVVLSLVFFFMLPAVVVICVLLSLALLMAAPCLMVCGSVRGWAATTEVGVRTGKLRCVFTRLSARDPDLDSDVENDLFLV